MCDPLPHATEAFSAGGFDDLFDGPLLRGALSAGARTAPAAARGPYPKSASEMRGHVRTGFEGVGAAQDTGHSSHVLRRPYAAGYGRDAPPPSWTRTSWAF